MRLRSLIVVALGAAVWATFGIGPSRAQEPVKLPHQKWSFERLLGSYDIAAAQRGFQVYEQVCSNCHSMNLLHYRDLAGIGLTAPQIKAVAAGQTVPGGTNDQGDAFTRPGLPSDTFRDPYANVKAAAAANGGKAPPDQTLLENAREGGADYIYALVGLGYVDPPKGVKVPDGLYYNKYYPGNNIHMPPPLRDGAVDYVDGTKATVPQMAHDVATFLAWTSNPELAQRKRMGVRIVLFLALMTGLTYAVKRQIWADVH